VGSTWKYVNNSRVIGIFIGSLVTFVILFGALTTYLPDLMYERFGASSTMRGIVVASASIATALTSAQLGRLNSYFAPRSMIRTSFVLYAVSLGLVPLALGVWLLFVSTAIFGIAGPILMALTTLPLGLSGAYLAQAVLAAVMFLVAMVLIR
jgi:MFS family permease